MEVLIVFVIFLVVLIAILVFPLIVKLLLARKFLATPRSDEAVFLTIDDGPSPESTPQVLEHLAASRARATFFVVGKKVQEHPELVAAILEQGHEIGSHGFAHLHPWRVSPLASLRDLRRGIAELAEHSVPGSGYFRPPYGKFGLLSATWVLATGMRPAFWSVDPRDYAAGTAEEVVSCVLERVRGGSVILLHDGFRRDGLSPDQAGEVVGKLLAELSARDYRFATLSEDFGQGGDAGR